MAYFVGRSVVVIALAFLLGLLVGWLWWRRRKVQFSESRAIAKVTTTHQARLDEVSTKLARAEAELRSRIADLDACRADLVDRTDEVAQLRAGAPVAAAAAAAAAAPVAAASVRSEPAVVDVTDGADALVTEPAGAGAGRDDAHGLVDVSSGSAAWAAETPPTETAQEATVQTSAAAQAPVQTAAVQAPAAQTEAAPAEATPVTLVSVPTDPSPEQLEALATPVADVRTDGHEAPAVAVAAEEAAAQQAAEAEAEADAGADVDAGDSAGDDLERVEGIGPRIGAALRGAGIHTFRQLADADTTTLQGALEQAGLRFAPSLPTWGRQARLLADGDEAGFVALTQQLIGGRDVSGTK